MLVPVPEMVVVQDLIMMDHFLFRQKLRNRHRFSFKMQKKPQSYTLEVAPWGAKIVLR